MNGALVTDEIVALLADLHIPSVRTGAYVRLNGVDLTDDEMKLIGEATIEDMAEAVRIQSATAPIDLSDLTDEALEVLAALVEQERERRA